MMNIKKLIQRYKGDVYFNKVQLKEINKCIKDLTKFTKVRNLNIDETIMSFINYTFSKYNVRLSKLSSYLGDFYDYYNLHDSLFYLVIFNESDEKNFKRFLAAYKKQLEVFYHRHVNLNKIEILKQAFLRTIELNLQDYNNYIQAQFDELEWTGQVVSPGHLNSEKAVLRYLEWKKSHVNDLRNNDWYKQAIKE